MAKQLSKDLVQQVNQQAGQMQRRSQTKPITLRETTTQDIKPSWSPTELGEQVLGFYEEAGADDGHDPKLTC
jgi:hypothetical protein